MVFDRIEILYCFADHNNVLLRTTYIRDLWTIRGPHARVVRPRTMDVIVCPLQRTITVMGYYNSFLNKKLSCYSIVFRVDACVIPCNLKKRQALLRTSMVFGDKRVVKHMAPCPSKINLSTDSTAMLFQS